MQLLEVSCTVRHIYTSLGAKGLIYGLKDPAWVIYLSIFPYWNIILSYAFFIYTHFSGTQLGRKTRSWCTYSRSQELICTFLKLRVQLLFYEKPPLAPTFKHMNPVHIAHAVTLIFILISHSINYYVWPVNPFIFLYQISMNFCVRTRVLLPLPISPSMIPLLQ